MSSMKGLLFSKRTINPKTNCWLWTGTLNRDGYGAIKYNDKHYAVHRLSYEIFIGDSWNQVLHRQNCLNRNCFNPSHLYDGTHTENMRDRDDLGTHNNQYKNTTHCIHGHEFTKENTYVLKTRERRCRECNRLRSARNRKSCIEKRRLKYADYWAQKES